MLSIAINVKNGEKYLARCLNALSRFEDVVLLDNYSIDKTLEIAKLYSNVRIFEHEFCGMGKVRNIAASFAKYDWVFFVDCDEIINPELVNTLLSTKFEDGYIYRIFRQNYYAGLRVSTSSWGNDWILRLYNRQQTRFEENQVHDSFIKNGIEEKKLIGGYIYHFPYDEVSQLINKMQFYSTLYAKQHFGLKKPKLYSLPFRAFIMFFKCYILKRGFLQGFEGLAISSYNAMGVFSKYIKLYELSYQKKIGLAFVIESIDENKLLKIFNHINEQTLLPSIVFVIINTKHITSSINVLERLICHNLVISGQVVVTVNKGIDAVVQNFLTEDPTLNNVVCVSEIAALENPRLFEQCRLAILKDKKLPKATIY